MKKGIIAAGILCLMLSGCGKKDKIEDDFLDVQGTVTESENGGLGTGESSEGEAEYKVNFTVESSVGQTELSADLVIDTRIPENMETKKVKRVEVDDAYLKTISSKIFDDGSYEVLKVNGYSLEESNTLMLEMMDSLETKLEAYGGVFQISTYYGYLSSDEASAEESSEGIIAIDSYSVEGDGETYVCNQKRAFIKGDIDGEPFILEYTKKDYEPNNVMYMDVEDILIYPMAGRQIYLELGPETMVGDSHADNKISYDDAITIAEDCIQDLGLIDYSLKSTFDIINDSNSKGICDLDRKMISGEISNDMSGNEKMGYRFVFTPGIDGVQIPYAAGYERTTADYDYDVVLDKCWVQPVVQIDVDATGLRGICINCIYESQEILSSDSKLISFEQANEIAKQMYSNTYMEDFEVGDIRLEYIIIQYADETVMVPAWVYYSSYGSKVSNLIFAVNALDGSVVHFNFNFAMKMRWIQ